MGSYCDKIVGYMIDVTEEFKRLDSESREKLLDTCLIFKNKFGEVEYKGYHTDDTPSNGDLTLIYDGMSGTYAKLVIIKEIIYDSDFEEHDDEIVVCINKELSKIEIKDSIKDKFEIAYESIFGAPNNMIDKIKLDYAIREKIRLEYLVHWH